MVRFADVIPTEEIRAKSLDELERLYLVRRAELFALKQEIDRRKGDVPQGAEVDFTKYVTK